jgi:hypothetical protein
MSLDFEGLLKLLLGLPVLLPLRLVALDHY